ncbi:MAG: ribonuclease PH [Acidimicrobiia bacterium]|nr:ribonuclease PH [Acidimicrobiia bacterium]MDH5422679.1 ribonuclease PH [Acidimicrobiia bacterium]MDH5505349.1 ribonuclease PH [Acidimicrobiia bacterium]
MSQRERPANELRAVRITRGFTNMTPGSVLIEMGETRVLCTASVERDVPRWMKGSGAGWVTAEYGMLPGSSGDRIRRNNYEGGRSKEISRLIGRSLRSVVNMKKMGEAMVQVDCDVLQADGGTRTAAITGAYIAMHDALSAAVESGQLAGIPVIDSVAAVSVGIVEGTPLLDLEYVDDVNADVDMNVVMTGRGLLVEVQGTAEKAAFTRDEFNVLLDLAADGIGELTAAQKELLGL